MLEKQQNFGEWIVVKWIIVWVTNEIVNGMIWILKYVCIYSNTSYSAASNSAWFVICDVNVIVLIRCG